MELKKLKINNLDAILDLEAICFPGEGWKKEDWEDLLTDERSTYYAFMDGERLVGSTFTYNWKGEHDYVKIMNPMGEDMSAKLEDLKNACFKDVPVPQGNAAVNMTLKYFGKDGLAIARRVVSAKAKEIAEVAASAVEARAEQEYQRMNHLLSMRGKAGNNAQLQQLRKNAQEWKKVISNPQIRLDAIRLLVCR